ncbi:MAG: efflux RND transporter periplasmic adaptor subunit, partial [Smithella sp.]|nr:efflux RND transporter periplasmic adaptor subunit [Smithella sp.]
HVWEAQVRKVRPHLETTGTLKAYEEVLVSAEVDGIIKNILVDEGSVVKAGQLLAQINDTDYNLDRERTQAAMRQAQASLENARAEYGRKEALFKDELITRQQFDDISTRVSLAEAELASVKATLAIAQERLARTKIYSPLNGAVKEKKLSAGDFVRNGMPVFQVISTNPLKLSFTVAEKDVARLKKDQEISFTVDAFPDKTFTGKVSLLYPNVEERTRTLQAEALVPNADRMLKPGYFARVQIFIEASRDAVVVPVPALLYDNATIRVFVVTAGKAEPRVVKIGNKYGEVVEITEGVQENEQVVVVGQNNLSEGVKVNVAR